MSCVCRTFFGLLMKILIALSCLALFISWLLPNHYSPWPSAYHEFIAFVTCLLISSASLVNNSPNARFEAPKIASVYLLLTTIPLLQYSLGLILFGGDAIISSLYMLGFILMFFSGYNLSRATGVGQILFTLVVGALLTAATLSTGLALYQWTLQPSTIWIADLPPNARPFANLAQPNQLATLLSMALAATLYFYEKHNLHRISSSLIAMVLLFGLALTQSRTPWLMAIFFIVLWLWKFHHAPRRLSRGWALVWVMVFVCFTLIQPQLTQWLQLGTGPSLVQRAQALERWDLYVQFYHAIIQGPLWGYGWQQVSTAQLAMTPQFPVKIYTEYTHNILLDLLIWNGPVLGGVIILAVGSYLLRLAFLARNTESVFLVLAIGFFLLHSLLEYPHAYAYFLLPVGLLLGCLQAQFPCRTWPVSRWLVLVFLIGSVGLYVVIWHEYRLIEEDYRLMRFEKNRVGTLKADKPAPDVRLLTQLQALTKHSRLPATPNMTAEEMEDLHRFSRRFTHPSSLYKYAHALVLNGKQEEAYQQLMLIRGLYGDKTLRAAISALEQSAEEHPDIEPLLQRLHAIELGIPANSSALTAPVQTEI